MSKSRTLICRAISINCNRKSTVIQNLNRSNQATWKGRDRMSKKLIIDLKKTFQFTVKGKVQKIKIQTEATRLLGKDITDD